MYIIQGYNISIKDFNTLKFKKIKEEKRLLSFIGFSKKKVEKNYRCFFDEYFVYFLKDIVINKKEIDLRKVGNKFDLRLVNNITLDVN